MKFRSPLITFVAKQNFCLKYRVALLDLHLPPACMSFLVQFSPLVLVFVRACCFMLFYLDLLKVMFDYCADQASPPHSTLH